MTKNIFNSNLLFLTVITIFLVHCASGQLNNLPISERADIVTPFKTKGKVLKIEFIAGKNMFATFHENDNKIVIWNALTKKVVRVIRGGTEKFAISPSGKYLATSFIKHSTDFTLSLGSLDSWRRARNGSAKVIAIYDLESGGKIQEVDLGFAHGALDGRLVFQDDKKLYSYDAGTHNKEIDIASGKITIYTGDGLQNMFKLTAKGNEDDAGFFAKTKSITFSNFHGLSIFNPEGTNKSDTSLSIHWPYQLDARKRFIPCGSGNTEQASDLICTISSKKVYPANPSRFAIINGISEKIIAEKDIDRPLLNLTIYGFNSKANELIFFDNSNRDLSLINMQTGILRTEFRLKEMQELLGYSMTGDFIVIHNPNDESFPYDVIHFRNNNKDYPSYDIKLPSTQAMIESSTNTIRIKSGNQKTTINLKTASSGDDVSSSPFETNIFPQSSSFRIDISRLDHNADNSAKYKKYYNSPYVNKNMFADISVYSIKTRNKIIDFSTDLPVLNNPKIWGLIENNKLYYFQNSFISGYNSVLEIRSISDGKVIRRFQDIYCKDFFVSKSKRYLFITDGLNKIHVFDRNTDEELFSLNETTSTQVTIDSGSDDRMIVSAGEDGVVSVWDFKGNHIAYILPTKEVGKVIFLDKNWNYLFPFGKLKEEPPFYFALGLNNYGFEQFDLQFNRPDRILKKLATIFPNSDLKARSAFFEKSVTTRLKQNGIKQDSENNQSSNRQIKVIHALANGEGIGTKKLGISFRSDSNVIGYKIFINGVPVHGDYIKRTYPGTDKLITDKEVKIEETIQLSQGENKIEVSAFTEDGVESPRESVTVKYDPPTKYKPELYFVGIGIDNYNASVNGGLDALKYAVKDSRELEDTFKKSGKNFAKVHTKVLVNAEVTRDSIGKLKEFLSKSRVDDHVILFLSGHGIRKDTKVGDLITAFGANVPPQYKLRNKSDVDDVYYYMTSDSHVDKPWDKAVPLDAIREIVNGIPSRQKIMLVDTCQSGEKLDLDDATVASLTKNVEIRKTRGKTAQTRGVKLVTTPGAQQKSEEVEKKIVQTIAKTNALKEMSELFPELRRGTGTIEISAATGAQSALESSEWKNGAFTFVIKEAILKGKAKDAKGNITARSLRKYVLEEVERLTDGQQTPMVARDIAGRDFVLFGK